MASYNEKSAIDNGWSPEHFGCDDFGAELKAAIMQFQDAHNLTADGLCGEKTVAVLLKSNHPLSKKSTLPCHSSAVPIDWDNILLWNQENGLKSTKYRKKYDRKPRLIIVHWDAALSSKSAFSTLERRGLSSHYLIDNDGCIICTVNPTHTAWHAGNSNNYSIGIEVSNAYYPKYQQKYVSMGFGERPIIKGAMVHGKKMRDHTGFYPVQLEALKALIATLCQHYDIPLDTPQHEDGTPITTVYSPAFKDYRGVVHHLHVSANKIDAASLNLVELIDDIKKKSLNK